MNNKHPLCDYVPLPDEKDKKDEEKRSWLELRVSELKSQNLFMQVLMGGVILVLFLGFLTLLIDAWRLRNNSYDNLIGIIYAQEKIIKENKQQQIEIEALFKELIKKK